VIVTVNGEPCELPEAASVADAVALLSPAAVAEGRGYAVAVGGEIVPRGAWTRTQLADGANIEVVAAIQGG
jgi:sulfur carrier protein